MRNLVLSVLALALFIGCKENIDMSNRYVFQENTIIGYLEQHEEYSDYLDIMNKVKVSAVSESSLYQLLSARGHYTCFAPTNEAIHEYLESLVEKGIIDNASWDAFEDAHILDSIQTVIVKNSIIDGGDLVEYETGGFPDENAEFELANMKDHKLSIHYGSNPDSLYINGNCRIDLKNRDITCINGVIHQMHDVVAPSDLSIAELLAECIEGKHSDYQVMAKLIKACGLMDTLSKTRDEAYELAYLRGLVQDYPANGLQSTVDGMCYVPQHKKIGFTIFAETDAFWAKTLNKKSSDISVNDVVEWIVDQQFYPNAKNNGSYTSADNVLNQFVTYHVLPMRIPKNKLVIHNNEKGYRPNTGTAYTIPVMEHYTTMGKPRLLKIYQSNETAKAFMGSESSGIYLNRFPVLDNSRYGTYHELSCDKEKEGILIYDGVSNINEFNTVNGMIYPIDGALAYTDEVQTYLMTTRIRFEVMSLFPEVMTNDIRQNHVSSARTQCVAFPQDNVYKYLENVTINEDTRTFCYFNAYGWNWNNYQGDELKGVGKYDYTFKLPPVPKRGTYEIRYKVLANGDRGVCQIYFGTNPDNLPIANIPMDLTIGGKTHYTSAGSIPSIVEWEEDTGDEDIDSDMDKRMRNNGFMKGPEAYWDGSITSRGQHWNVRRVIVRQTMDPNEQYYLRFKSCIDSERKEFYMDYIEYCSKDVYDNPESPEDIW